MPRTPSKPMVAIEVKKFRGGRAESETKNPRFSTKKRLERERERGHLSVTARRRPASHPSIMGVHTDVRWCAASPYPDADPAGDGRERPKKDYVVQSNEKTPNRLPQGMENEYMVSGPFSTREIAQERLASVQAEHPMEGWVLTKARWDEICATLPPGGREGHLRDLAEGKDS
jgi:hypothetical protein